MMMDDVERDDGLDIGDEHLHHLNHHQPVNSHYSLYEPNYQQLHPLIYYEDLSPAITHHHHQLNGNGIAPTVNHQVKQQQHHAGPQQVERNPNNTEHVESTVVNVSTSSISNRELHNEIERRRRSRIKNCCEILRTLVPGVTDKTDKATVLEHTVSFVKHLMNCPGFNCKCLQ